jgi:8-oxo-dGTP pyrophosphatase MutT (NUDIX family)
MASLFLAGPTSRTDDLPSWRPDALNEITRLWAGTGTVVVFMSEPRSSVRSGARWPADDAQRAWEVRWGDRVDVVLFWTPRAPGTEGRTADIEWGCWAASGRAVLGTPSTAEHAAYQREFASRHHIPFADTLPAAICRALEHIGPGAARRGGQREVPLLLWRTASFRAWLTAQEEAGNELRGGRLEWTFRIGPARDIVVFWAFHAQLYIAAEDRVKANEVVLGRPDIATVVAFHRGPTVRECRVLLIREVRSPAATADGFVRELPGGSGLRGDPREQAAAELYEETGLRIATHRFRVHPARQLVATVSTHQQHVFSVELSDDEMLGAGTATALGNADETERTYPTVTTVGDILDRPGVDWATIGAIMHVLAAEFTTI